MRRYNGSHCLIVGQRQQNLNGFSLPLGKTTAYCLSFYILQLIVFPFIYYSLLSFLLYHSCTCIKKCKVPHGRFQWADLMNARNGGNMVDNTLDYQSRGREISLLVVGGTLNQSSHTHSLLNAGRITRFNYGENKQ